MSTFGEETSFFQSLHERIAQKEREREKRFTEILEKAGKPVDRADEVTFTDPGISVESVLQTLELMHTPPLFSHEMVVAMYRRRKTLPWYTETSTPKRWSVSFGKISLDDVRVLDCCTQSLHALPFRSIAMLIVLYSFLASESDVYKKMKGPEWILLSNPAKQGDVLSYPFLWHNDGLFQTKHDRELLPNLARYRFIMMPMVNSVTPVTD